MLSTCKIFLPLQEGKVCYSIGGGGGGNSTPHMKGVRILVVSLTGVNFGFWSQNAIIFIRDGSRLGLQAKKKNISSVFHMVSIRGQRKAWATPRSIGLL